MKPSAATSETTGKRKHTLVIWVFALGYFFFYIPYSGLIKALTNGLIPGAERISGLRLLPPSLVATALLIPLFITAMGWWKHLGRRRLLGRELAWPGAWSVLSGVGFATIIATTTMAYTFPGVSIVFALLLLRGGVLTLAPMVDAAFRRKVRWFSWIALVLSLSALAVALSDVGNYRLTWAAALNVAAYLTGYMIRLPCMSKAAKSQDKEATYRFFVGEQTVAMPTLVLIPALFALLGSGEAARQLRLGFADLWTVQAWPGIAVGALYACLAVCGTMIYLDWRENTFCIPLNRCSSLLSGVVASVGLALLAGSPGPTAKQLAGVALILVALMFLSPLHHLDRVLGGLRVRLSPKADWTPAGAIARRVFLFVCDGNTFRSPVAQFLCQAEIARRLKVSATDLEQAGISVRSAGLAARQGSPWKPIAEQALDRLGVAWRRHQARLLQPEDARQAEAIFCMTESQRRAILERFPEAASKTRLLLPGTDLPEPSGDLDSVVELVGRIQRLVRERLDEIGPPDWLPAGREDGIAEPA